MKEPFKEKKKPYFSHYLRKENQEPPGFIPIRTGATPIGIIPSVRGGCKWIGVARAAGMATKWGEIPDKEEWKAIQKDWLQSCRRRLGWDESTSKIGVSRRTWEGWENGGRSLPYFQAARIAYLFWIASHDELAGYLPKRGAI
jgi:hypothetical protein